MAAITECSASYQQSQLSICNSTPPVSVPASLDGPFSNPLDSMSLGMRVSFPKDEATVIGCAHPRRQNSRLTKYLIVKKQMQRRRADGRYYKNSTKWCGCTHAQYLSEEEASRCR